MSILYYNIANRTNEYTLQQLILNYLMLSNKAYIIFSALIDMKYFTLYYFQLDIKYELLLFITISENISILEITVIITRFYINCNQASIVTYINK